MWKTLGKYVALPLAVTVVGAGVAYLYMKKCKSDENDNNEILDEELEKEKERKEAYQKLLKILTQRQKLCYSIACYFSKLYQIRTTDEKFKNDPASSNPKLFLVYLNQRSIFVIFLYEI